MWYRELIQTSNVLSKLQGTGPWDLEVQVVGPTGSEIVKFPNISESKKILQIPIPKIVDRDGGSFEIELGRYRYHS